MVLMYLSRRSSKEIGNKDRKKFEKTYKAMKLLVFGIGPDEYNNISAYEKDK